MVMTGSSCYPACYAQEPGTLILAGRHIFIFDVVILNLPRELTDVLVCRFQAQIPQYLYPFLTTNTKTQPFEYLRLTSLGVIGALVKVRP